MRSLSLGIKTELDVKITPGLAARVLKIKNNRLNYIKPYGSEKCPVLLIFP